MKLLAAITGAVVYPFVSICRNILTILTATFITAYYLILFTIQKPILGIFVFIPLSLLITSVLLPLMAIATAIDIILAPLIGIYHGFQEGFSKIWSTISKNPMPISLLNRIESWFNQLNTTTSYTQMGHTQGMLNQLGEVEMNTTFEFSSIKTVAPEHNILSEEDRVRILRRINIGYGDKEINTLLREKLELYKNLQKHLDENTDEIVHQTEIEGTKIILFKQYQIDEVWETLPNSVHIGDIESCQTWFSQRATHPLTNEDLREPEKVEINGKTYPTRYQWHEYAPENGQGFGLLNDYADSMRSLVKIFIVKPQINKDAEVEVEVEEKVTAGCSM